MPCSVKQCIAITKKKKRCRNCIVHSNSTRCRVHQQRASLPVIFALAMNRHAPSDIVRVTELEKSARVITVSESRLTTNGEHIDTNFKIRLQTLIAHVETVALDSNAHITVLLDYFWLQQNYYRTNYSLDWLQPGGKVEQLLRAGADCVILPHDVGSNIDTMLEHTTLASRPLAASDHPLWVATEQVSLVGLQRGAHETQLRYLKPQQPFLYIGIEHNSALRPAARVG